ncbi:MAG: hypothetical protein NTV89_18305 [Proteobacteria bacterium]|nr:hypothetical protein [Pseudomonadota bacterium]
MAIDQIANWQIFAKHMEEYIRKHTVEKYTADGNAGYDLMALTNSPLICIWNVLKYAFRIWKNRMKPHDLEKIVHYAEMAWTMAEGKIIRNGEAGQRVPYKVIPSRNAIDR